MQAALAHTTQLIETLREIAGETETVFLELADVLPRLVHEMQESFTRSEQEMQALDLSGSGRDSDCQVCDILSLTRETLSRWSRTFVEMETRDNELFRQLRDGIGHLEGISSSIDQIKGDSEDMELVSINAMTVALKAGNAGRAFSYITEELKRLSSRTITLTEEITRYGQDLIRTFTSFEKELEETGDSQRKILASFQEKIARSIDNFALLVDAIVARSQELHQQSRHLQDPIHRMMETIQLQDIIRQSIDHIIVALEVIKPEEQLEDDEALLDEVTFLRDIPPLAQALIDDVAGQIDDSVATFQRLTDQAEQQLAALETQRQAFMEGRFTGHDGKELSFEVVLEQLSSVLDEIVADLDRNMARKETLVDRSTTIASHVEELQTRFKSFDSLVTRFHSIDIAARIEVAKQKVLREMGTTTSQMTALTRTIESDVEQSLETTKQFIGSAATIRDHHHTLYRQEKDSVAAFRAEMQSRYRTLRESHHSVSQSVQGFSLFSRQFFEVFSHSKAHGVRLGSTSTRIRALKADLAEMEAAIQLRYQELLTARGLTEWKIEDTRLREIIERFTIFTHKQKAGELAGFEVESGTESGEITFF